MVRDEAVRLRRCLESAHGAFDEIVVLDTGSKDDTVSVAKSLGARVSEMEWPGSFSLGFNTLLDQIRTEWVFRLDSDEWFGIDPKPPLKDALKDDGKYGYKLQMRDILPTGGHREFAIFRMWRSHPLLRYRGAVHENIPNEAITTAYPGKTVGELGLWVWHDGYAHGESKTSRNLALIEQELEEKPDQPYYQAMRALMYRDSAHPRCKELLVELIDTSVDEAIPSTRMLASIFVAFLADASEEEMGEQRVAKVIQRAWQWFGDYPGVVWVLGASELKRRNLAGALRAYLVLEQMVETSKYERSIPFNTSILGPSLWHGLGFVAQQLGRNDIAERCMKRLMQT
jgi:hypothetical protein